jgi:hypothetical protein
MGTWLATGVQEDQPLMTADFVWWQMNGLLWAWLL